MHQSCAETVPPNTGWVYFIRAGDAIKIGYSKKLVSRLTNLQTSTHHNLRLLAKVKGSLATERRYHSRFAVYRIKEEWFMAAGPVLAEIDRLNGKRAAPICLVKTDDLPATPKAPVEPKPPLPADVQAQVRALDGQSRRTKDKTQRMKIELRMAMERDEAPANYKARQDTLMGVKPRIRVRAISAEHRP